MKNQTDDILIEQPISLRVDVCGGIASGKTTFTLLMKRMGFITLLENFEINPFLKEFYLDPFKYAFETEISFILQHYHQIKKEELYGKINVCDFSFFLDLAYAEIGLHGTKLEAFRTIHDEIRRDLPPAVLLIHLDCNAEKELRRIRSRGRTIEESINLEYLEKLNVTVERQVETARRELKVLTIDSAIKDFANNEITKREVIKLVSESLQDILGKEINTRLS